MIISIYIIIICAYIAILLYGISGWLKNENTLPQTDTITAFSIVISLRNESAIIENLVSSLKNIQYPKELFEIIIINDHSTDSSLEQLQVLTQNEPNFFILTPPESVYGKKSCIAFGIQKAKNPYILFTDADCKIPTTWLETYDQNIQNTNADFYFGLVNHTKENSWLQKWFTLDFLSMIIMQAGFAKYKHAFSCNAANMCVSKKFLNTHFNSNKKYSSGDDVFLLHKAKSVGANIEIITDNNATIYTSAPKDLQTFIKQRIRWSSKATAYTDNTAVLVSGIVYITNFFICCLGIFALFSEYYLNHFIILLCLKTIIDFVFFAICLPALHKQRLVWHSIPFQLFYVIYITFIPIFAFVLPYNWKDRKLKK